MTKETPSIESDRLTLEPFSDVYLSERYVGWLNDPEIVRYAEPRHRNHSLESSRAFMESFSGSASHFWAVVAHDPALGHIGNIHAEVGPTNRVVDVTIVIGDTSARGQGYGLEAFRTACDWLLDEGGMRKVTTGTLALNEGMLAIMAKMNMVDDGIRRAHVLIDGAPVDIVHAALFADE